MIGSDSSKALSLFGYGISAKYLEEARTFMLANPDIAEQAIEALHENDTDGLTSLLKQVGVSRGGS